MPYEFDASVCEQCSLGYCIEDRRNNPVRGRTTQFRLKQATAIACTFEKFIPGFGDDPDTSRDYNEYLGQFRSNALSAGNALFGTNFNLKTSAIAKVEGDVFELLESAALWNAAAAWNHFMVSGEWNSGRLTCPEGAIPTPHRKVAIVPLPRGYDATLLFDEATRANISAFELALRRRDMELGLSCPDIVGVRLPAKGSEQLEVFEHPIPDLKCPHHDMLVNAYKRIEGSLVGANFLFAIAIKRTVRSDRLYQPLFEANVLKFLIEEVLRGAAFRFYVHAGSTEGADAEGHYRAASLYSLLRGGEPQRAVNKLHVSRNPLGTAQAVLDDFTLFTL